MTILYLEEINKPKFARLGLLTEKIETMKNQRVTLLNDLRQKIQTDDITKLVLMRRQENHKVRNFLEGEIDLQSTMIFQ